ncbi:MAG: hypothetical protein NTV21_18285 [Planctomycetota bacterium]|nr:hypothetical protein [Planctomycetota bacterium]
MKYPDGSDLRAALDELQPSEPLLAEMWMGFVAPYVHAVLLAIAEHRAWARQEVGLDPNSPLIRSDDLAVTLDGRFRSWKSYIGERRLPSHRQRDAAGPRCKIETLMAQQLDAVQRLVPIATPEMRKFLEALDSMTDTKRVPAVDLLGRPYPRGWDVEFRHALGTAFCWLIVDFYAAAWNRHWFSDLGIAANGAPSTP